MGVCKKTLYFFIFLGILNSPVHSADTDIVINEIMYDLSGADADHEWIEIYNKGEVDVDLTGWRFEEGGTQHTLSGSTIIPGGGYAIIADKREKFLSDYPSFTGNLIDSSFSLSNTGESLILRNSYNGTIIDTVTYSNSWGGSGNDKSLEKINPLGNNTSSNWGESTEEKGTPDAQNSIYNIPEHNLTISSSDISFDPSSPAPNSNITITATIHNTGTNGETNADVEFYNGDPDGVGSLISTEMIISSIAAGTTASTSVEWSNVAEGTYTIYVKVILSSDEDDSDNKASRNLIVANLPEVVINEFLAAPETVYNEEWIELYNKENTLIDISNWQLDDIEGGTTPYTLPEGTTIEAKGFLVFYKGETGIILNNNGDTVRFLNSTGTLIDSHSYTQTSYDISEGRVPDGEGIWTTFNTPTPGVANSNDSPEIVNVERNPLYPGNKDRVKASCEVKDSDLSSVTLKYSTGGDYVSVNMSLESEKYKGEIPAYGEGVKVNYYVEAEDSEGQTSISSTYFYTVGVNPRIVINEFLADPASDWNNDNEINSNDEWIELYNKESTPVDISNWVLDDIENGGTKPYTIGTTIEVGGFLVFYKSETKIALNNGGDTVRLLDNGGNLVDSYSYTTSSDDVSQGRVPDGENVWTSLDVPSPGNPNPETVSTSSSGDVIINEIMYDPVSNDYDCEWIELYNKEDKPVNLKGWELDGKEISQTTIGAYSYLVITDDLLDRDNDGYSFEEDWGDGSGIWGDWAGENFTVMEVSISFSNKGDTVILNDGIKDIDVLTYESSWGGGKGVSLERINSNLPNLKTNWGSSIIPNGATPGKLNSLAEKSIHKPILLINEINFKVSPNWVEIYCKDDSNNGKGVNLAGYYLTDLDVADKIIGNTTIKTGEYLLLHYGADYVDETSSSEGNKNGIIDIWTDVSGITATNEQIVLYNAVYTIVDAVCWSNRALSDSEKRDLEEIYEAGEWDGKTADDCIDSQEIGTKKTIARQNFEDTNSQNDWIVSFPTPGWDNSDLEKANQAVKITSFRILPKVFFPHGDGNPTNTTISYILSKEAEVTIRIYDVKGRLINTLVEQELLLSGVNETVWDGKDEDGDIVSLGIYICYLEAVCSQGNDTAKKTVVAAKKLN